MIASSAAFRSSFVIVLEVPLLPGTPNHTPTSPLAPTDPSELWRRLAPFSRDSRGNRTRSTRLAHTFLACLLRRSVVPSRSPFATRLHLTVMPHRPSFHA